MDTEQKDEEQSFGGTLNRRANNRFPVKEEVRYRLLQSNKVRLVGAGRTIDVSSGGILFTSSEPLPTGRSVEISMNWPARLDGTCPLQLVVSGRILRADATKAAMRIERYEFRTRSSAAAAGAALPR